jgi:hypothetical protein
MMRTYSNLRAVTLVEMILATAIVGVVAMGIVSSEQALRKHGASTMESTSANVSSKEILNHVLNTASQAVGNTGDPGIIAASGSLSVRVNDQPPTWVSYTLVGNSLYTCAGTGPCTSGNTLLGQSGKTTAFNPNFTVNNSVFSVSVSVNDADGKTLTVSGQVSPSAQALLPDSTCSPACTGGTVCSGGSCCTPNCAGKICGGDGCGGSCGPCGGGLVCNGAGTQCIGTCGSNGCETGENCSNCPSDCGACANCGDGTCNGGENCTSCASDCGACVVACGNGVCTVGETCASCPNDCGACSDVCGNTVCRGGETCSSCPLDCGACPIVTGDGVCAQNEDCNNSPADCGTCTEDSDPNVCDGFPDGTMNVCGDGEPCTNEHVCSGGSCSAGSPVECSDGDPCNGTETCQLGVGCVVTPPAPCAAGEYCVPGAGCVSVVCNDDNPCTSDSYNDAMERCEFTPIPNCMDCAGVPDGTAVNDCNGICGGPAVLDACGVCGGDGSTCCPAGTSMCGGSCVNDVSLVFICCDGCAAGETCVSDSGGASCQAVPDPCLSMSCDDSDPCTDDACSGGTCFNVDNGSCVVDPCLSMNCDDSDPCTDDTCSAGSCVNTDNGTCGCIPDCTSAGCGDSDGCGGTCSGACGS